MSGEIGGDPGGAMSTPAWVKTTPTEGEKAKTGENAEEDFEEVVAGGGAELVSEFFEGNKTKRTNRDAKIGKKKTASQASQAHASDELTDKTVNSKTTDEIQQQSKLLNKNAGGEKDLGNPLLDKPAEGGNLFLQTGSMVSAILAALKMLRTGAKARRMDRETRTNMTMMSAEFKQVAAELTKAQRMKEAQGQMIKGMMQIAQGALTVVGGMSSMAMGTISFGTSVKGATAQKNAYKAGNEVATQKTAYAGHKGRAMALKNDPASLRAARNGQASTHDTGTPNPEADIQASEAFKSNAAAGKYEITKNPGGPGEQTLNSRDNPAEFEAAAQNPDAPIKLAGSRQAEVDTNKGLENTSAQKQYNENIDEAKAHQVAAGKSSEKLDTAQKSQQKHNQTAQKAQQDSQNLNMFNQGFNGMMTGMGQMLGGMGEMIDAAYKMQAADLEYGSRQASISAELIDAHMKIIDSDIDDYRQAITKALDVLDRINSVANKSANMRG